MNTMKLNRAGIGNGMTDVESWLARVQFKMGAIRRATFFEKMASLVRDGMPLDAALRQMLTRAQEKRRPMAPILKVWVTSLGEGKTLADATKGYVSDVESVILASGERSGELGSAFEQAALVARSNADILRALRSELTTPVVQVVALIGLLIVFSTKIAPGLRQSVPESAMDESQRALFHLAGVVSGSWYFILPVLLAMFGLAIWSMPRYVGSLRKYLDRIPPWSVYRVYTGSTFMISLAALIKSGVPIESAIRFIRQHSSPYLREHLGVMAARLRSGSDPGDAMDVGLLGDDLSDTVAVYSKTTNFDSAMNAVGREAIKTGIDDIKVKASVVKIIATLLIGAFIGWMFDSMMGIGDAATRAQQQQTARGR